jgi:hypothetical protein
VIWEESKTPRAGAGGAQFEVYDSVSENMRVEPTVKGGRKSKQLDRKFAAPPRRSAPQDVVGSTFTRWRSLQRRTNIAPG